MIAADEGGEIRLVRDVEEDRERPRDEADGVELPDRQAAGNRRDGDRCERRGTAEVGDDHDLAAREPIDPNARGEGEKDER